MRRPARLMVISFTFVSCVAAAAPACATTVAQPPWSDAQIELAGGGLQHRCSMAETRWGPQRRRQGGGPGDRAPWSADGGSGGHGEKVDGGDSGSRGGWSGVYGGWNGGYRSGRGD